MNVPGDPWLLETVPKDCFVQMLWDVSSSFPWLISGPLFTELPACTSVGILSLSSSHDPSLSHSQAACVHPISQPGPPFTGTTRCWCSQDREKYSWCLAAAQGQDTAHGAEVNAQGSMAVVCSCPSDMGRGQAMPRQDFLADGMLGIF